MSCRRWGAGLFRTRRCAHDRRSPSRFLLSRIKHHLCREMQGRTPTPVQLPPRFTTRLADEQLNALRACAKGISLRFEKAEIVRALLAGGYVSNNVAGVITITEEGDDYLRKHAL